MKNLEREEKPILQLDRDPVLLGLFVLATCVLVYFTYSLFKNFNPWGFLLMIPAGAMAFQTLWFILNPFAILFEDRLEVKHSLFKNKQVYFVDLKKKREKKKGRYYITYMDDELEPLNLFGIKKSQVTLLKNEFNKQIISNQKLRN